MIDNLMGVSYCAIWLLKLFSFTSFLYRYTQSAQTANVCA